MARQSNTTATGGSFSEATINLVWSKATVSPGQDSAKFRKDRCGAWIARSSYGTLGDHGWEIDHDKPVAKQGSDDLGNLQPLHWKITEARVTTILTGAVP